MKVRHVCDLPPKEDNPRNSEGAFLRSPSGEILFAYSSYLGEDGNDHAACNISLIRSYDEGESWTETPEVIARASEFGTKNVMSVSALTLLDGSPAFFYLIKEPNGTTTLGRSVSCDGGRSFTQERVNWDAPSAYYVINNDRLVRTSDGRIVAPASYYPPLDPKRHLFNPGVAVLLISDDDGATFSLHDGVRISFSESVNVGYGMQEPGILELSKDVFWMWMRTGAGYQYESFSVDGLRSFSPPRPSQFTSPDSPMQVVRYDENTLYVIYNPIPNYNGRNKGYSWGRTPLVIRKSTDNGKTFSWQSIIEESEGDRGFCYPGVFFTNDGSMLIGYCRGDESDGCCLFRLGIVKIKLTEIR